MITPSFGLTATERVLPKLALDFTTASLDARVTFTRSGDTATRTNANGYIESVLANTPRFDYDPVTLACKGLLIEEARTNVLTYSNDISNAAWAKAGNASVAASTEVSPSGTTDAYKLIGGDGGTAYLYRAAGYVTTATAHTISVYMKKGTVNTVNLFFVTAGSTQGAKCAFDSRGLVGTITNYGSVTGTTASVTSVGNGWYRCSMTLTTTADTYYAQVTTVGAVFTNLYGFQVEQGAFATSYIPTTTTALTRNADVAVMTGTNFSDWFNASEGAFDTTVTPRALDLVNGNAILSVNDTTNFNRYYAYTLATSAIPNLQIRASSTVYMQAASGTSAANAPLYACFAYKTNNCAFSTAGNSATVDTSVTLPTVTQFQIGAHGTAVYLNGWVEKVNYWPQRLTNSEVQAFSKG